MKKLMCVLILVAFVGSMVVMTGCFGGSSGGLFAGLAIALIITASGGTGGAIAFAANQRGALRPAVEFKRDVKEINFVITPITDAGVKGPVTTYTGTQLVDKDDGTLELNIPSYDVTSYNQYLIEVNASDVLLLKATRYLAAADKSGTKSVTVDPTETAKTLLYEKWNADGKKTYSQFTYNYDKATTVDIASVTSAVNAAVASYANGITTTVNFDSFDVTGEADKIGTEVEETQYTVSGYVTTKDGLAGQDDCMIEIFEGEQMLKDALTEGGNWSVHLPDGTYRIVPSKQDHTYEPESRTITVNGANVTSVNFQAK